MSILTIPRLTVERQRNVGARLAELLRAEAGAKSKRPASVVQRASEFLAAHEALGRVSTVPKLAVDTAADRAFGAFHNTLAAIEQTFTAPLVPLSPRNTARFDAARALRREVFPRGVGFLRGSMDSQYRIMREVVAALRSAKNAAAVKALDVGDTVDFLEALLAPYGVAVKGPNGVDVEQLSVAWHAAFTDLAAALTGTLPADDTLRTAVFDAYERQLDEQSDALAAARRARKKAKPATA